MDSASLLADANVLQALREHAAWQSPCELVEHDGLIMMAGSTGFPGAFKNCVARVDPTVPATRLLARARAFFGARRRSFSVLVRASQDADLEELLNEQDFLLRFDTPCMLVTAPVAPVVPAVLAASICIEPFASHRQVRDAVSVMAQAYQTIGLEPDETRAYFSDPARLVARKIRGWVAYRDGIPLAAALTISSRMAAGVYWVGTVPDAQRLGLASACTAIATNDAFAQGAQIVTLQASSFGEPVYQRLGYQTYDRFKSFRSPNAPS